MQCHAWSNLTPLSKLQSALECILDETTIYQSSSIPSLDLIKQLCQSASQDMISPLKNTMYVSHISHQGGHLHA
jgi:hypothetical protein